MDWGLFWAIAGPLVAVVGIIAAIIIYRLQSPRRRILFDTSSRRIVAVRASKLEVTYDGVTVTNPHITTVRLFASGRADIGSSLFDSGNPLEFVFDKPIMAGSLQFSGDIEVQESGDRFIIEPQKIAGLSNCVVTFLTEDEPGEPEVINSLLDVKVTSRVIFEDSPYWTAFRFTMFYLGLAEERSPAR